MGYHLAEKTEAALALGKTFSRARRQRGLTASQVAAALNIPVRHLEAIEEGDFSAFAAEIYARGACLKYAAYLGLEGDFIERMVWRALSVGRQPVPLRVHTAFSWFERAFTPRLLLWACIGLVVFIIGAYIVWQVQTYLQLPALQLVGDLPAVVAEDVLVVQGKAEADAKVTLNGQLVILQPDLSFAVRLYVHPGINVVRLEAENAAGRKAVVERHILYGL